jgi:hypothetical protein
MKNDPSENARKAWNTQHALLRRLLEDDRDLPGALAVFLEHHAPVHSAQLTPMGGLSFQDEVLQGLTEAHMRLQVPGHVNTVVWMLWHITRIEDATINVLLADAPQVFQQGNWQRETQSPFVDVGNEMTAEEINALSQAINLEALLTYRLAVGRRTREVVQQVKGEELWGKAIPARLEGLAADGTVREKARWLLDYWGGHPMLNLLLMPASRHPFVHLNEIQRMLPRLKKQGA